MTTVALHTACEYLKTYGKLNVERKTEHKIFVHKQLN